MENQENELDLEREPDYYGTGTTQPPKSKRGLIAILLVFVILLCGIVSVLGVANVRLLNRINQTEQNVMVIQNTTGRKEPADATEGVTDEKDPENPLLPLPTSVASVDNVTQENGLSLQEIYEKSINSVVSISGTYGGGSSTGTGVILTPDGCIVTNCHVVENAERIQVLLTDGRVFEASVIGMDEISDLAVLDVEAQDLSAAELGDSSVLRVGDSVVAIGDPLGVELRGSMTDGIVSAINRDIDVDGRTMNLIQTNAALNSGNSGGPLINCYGQVIGINTMKMGDSMSVAGVEGLGFAIPSTTVRDIVNQLVEQGYVSGRPDLGISGESVSTFYQIYYHLPAGLLITEVKENGSAAQAGINRGDILLSIDEVRVTDSETLRSRLYSYTPGDQVQVMIYRNGTRYTVTLTVGEANG